MQQEQKELLQALYEELREELCLTALKMNVPECEVDDIIQDTFCKFMGAYGDNALEWDCAHRKAKLLKILKNGCYDYFRRLKRKGTISIDSEESQAEYKRMQKCLMGDMCDGLITKEEICEARRCIEDMKPTLRDVAVLYLIQGRTVPEVCEILEISSAACKMRISRIKKYLREQLKP